MGGPPARHIAHVTSGALRVKFGLGSGSTVRVVVRAHRSYDCAVQPALLDAPRLLRNTALFLAVWAVVVLFTVTQFILTYSASGNSVMFGMTLKVAVVQWLPWVVVAPPVLVLANAAPLRGARWPLHALLHVGALLAGAAAIVTLTFVAQRAGGFTIRRTWTAEFLRSVHSIAVVYGLLLVGAHAAATLRRTRAREQHVARLEAQLADARLAALRAQLHPHFLFNTLHGISSLIHEQPDAAEDMLTALSDLLRATLSHGDRNEVTLRDELALLEQYLEIQKMRLGDRLQVGLFVSPDVLDLAIPSFVLQPLAENAIRYAIATRASGGRLEVHATRAGETLRLTVIDDGPGLRAATRTDARGWGLGLSTTRARLGELYGDAHRLVLEERPEGGVSVIIEVPAHRPAELESVA
jgi:two-component system, LytTR family, sensor kinase